MIKVHIQENLRRITFMGKESTNGLMVGSILEIGNVTKWMVKEYSLGRMVGDIREDILKI
jgi:hypothetical protein